MTNYRSKQKFIVPLIALDFYKALDPVLIIHSENNSAPEISAQILMRMNSPTECLHRVLFQQLDQENQSYQCSYPDV
jgi:hypothetical protein